ncbi:MAG: hypothetical protein H6Q13_1644 [Bacteroidetes bacterium]|nr:hypothetical protein [Bacteroidota bacterium]
MDYKTVLIVGNGFDLNLGLKTSYDDFMKSKEFDDLSNNSLVDHLRKKKVSTSWIDIENELTAYSHSIFIREYVRDKMEQRKLRIINLRSEYQSLCSALKLYLNKCNNISGYPNNTAITALDNALETWPTYILTFNYTNTIESILKDASYREYQYKINHIHGSLSSKIVFGVEDTAKLEKDHIFLHKSYSQNCNIQGVNLIFNSADNFIFFGYSLGQTDHSYFDDFLKAQTLPNAKKKSFIFYHYGEEAYDDLIWQLKVLTGNRLSYLKNYNDLKFINIKR